MSEKTKRNLSELGSWTLFAIYLTGWMMCIGIAGSWVKDQIDPPVKYVDTRGQHKQAVKEAFTAMTLDTDLTQQEATWEQAYFDEADNTTYQMDTANLKFIKLEQGKTLKVPIQKNLNTGADNSVFTYEYQFYLVDGSPMVKYITADGKTHTKGLEPGTIANELFVAAYDYKVKHQ